MLALRLPLRLALRLPPSHTRLAAPQLAKAAAPLISSRAFASPGRPKKSESSNKPKKTTTTTTTTRAKPRATASKPKKVLTPEQKAERAARKKDKQDKDVLRELKKAALSPPSRRAVNSFIVYMTENAKGKNISDVGTLARQMAQEYKNLSSREREHYNHLTTESNVKSQREFDEWILSHTPAQIRDANMARKKLRAKVANKAKYRPIKDTRLVKKPSSLYVHFYLDRIASGDFRGVPAMQAAKDVSAEFKALSASEKKKYENAAVKDIERYQKEHLEVYGVEAANVSKIAATGSPTAAA